MFDFRELARKALLRAEEIKKERRRKRLRAITVGSALCTCLAVLFILLYYITPYINSEKQDCQIRYIDEPYVPLARPPTAEVETCSECGAEIEEEHCCHEEVNEQCEFCKRE